MRLAITLIGIIILHSSSLAQQTQDAKSILERVVKTLDAPNYSFEMSYTLFRDASTTKAEESYRGKMIKQSGQYYTKIHKTESIQWPTAFIKVNHEEKALFYSSEALTGDISTAVDLVALFSGFETSAVTQTKDTYICTFSSKAITNLSYVKALIYIDKSTNMINKQVLYLADQLEFETESGKELSNPRLEIVFTNFKTDKIISKDVFTKEKYISINKGEVKPSNSLKDYEFINGTKALNK